MALRRHHSPAALLVALGLIASACLQGGPSVVRLDSNGIPIGAVSAAWIAQQPLAHLYYPGATPFFTHESSSDEKRGSDPSDAGAVLTSSATGAQIYAWYTQALKAQGWRFITDNGCSSSQVSCPQFAHDGHGHREAFSMSVDNPALLNLEIAAPVPPGACTVWDIDYAIYPPGGVSVPAAPQFNGGDQCWWTGTSYQRPTDVP